MVFDILRFMNMKVTLIIYLSMHGFDFLNQSDVFCQPKRELSIHINVMRPCLLHEVRQCYNCLVDWWLFSLDCSRSICTELVNVVAIFVQY